MLEIVGYGYDPAGNITRIEQPCSTTRYTYDAAYRCITLTLPGGDEVSFDYDEDNRRTDAHFPGGFHQHWQYDAAGRVTAVEARNASGDLLDRSTYRYTTNDGADTTQIQEITGWFSPQPLNASATCDYDSLGQLTRIGQYHYTFDAATNLITSPDGTFRRGSRSMRRRGAVHLAAMPCSRC
ncbi:hypothetical protein [Saccharopolyspora griseoalba]|uniref:Teneurin-like YD-shell domain-containing protein n=1 Tax=Saccharopolyspora griseoalba TaxID=1431848 RepID=A0ABW2LQR0_9PSEU